MPRIAVTGHMNLHHNSVPLVSEAISSHLSKMEPARFTGLSCLARGADSIFARAVIAARGQLEVYLPCEDYRSSKVKPDHAAEFDDLLSHASVVHVMPFTTAGREAYEAANQAMLTSCDELLAVWDGQPPLDKGGTAAVVHQARTRGIPVAVIWPSEARRDSG